MSLTEAGQQLFEALGPALGAVLAALLDPQHWMFWVSGGLMLSGGVLVALFLQRSSAGIAIRGAAERADRASMLGIPVKRLSTIVWAIASLLAFLAMFLRAGSVGLPIGSVLGPTFFLQALAAAVIGRLERFPTIAVAALALGVLDQAMTFQPNNHPAYNDVMLFVVVLLGLLLTSRASGARSGSEAQTWQAAREVRPIPRELAITSRRPLA